jgi:hypothetical protein
VELGATSREQLTDAQLEYFDKIKEKLVKVGREVPKSSSSSSSSSCSGAQGFAAAAAAAATCMNTTVALGNLLVKVGFKDPQEQPQ